MSSSCQVTSYQALATGELVPDKLSFQALLKSPETLFGHDIFFRSLPFLHFPSMSCIRRSKFFLCPFKKCRGAFWGPLKCGYLCIFVRGAKPQRLGKCPLEGLGFLVEMAFGHATRSHLSISWNMFWMAVRSSK